MDPQPSRDAIRWLVPGIAVGFLLLLVVAGCIPPSPGPATPTLPPASRGASATRAIPVASATPAPPYVVPTLSWTPRPGLPPAVQTGEAYVATLQATYAREYSLYQTALAAAGATADVLQATDVAAFATYDAALATMTVRTPYPPSYPPARPTPIWFDPTANPWLHVPPHPWAPPQGPFGVVDWPCAGVFMPGMSWAEGNSWHDVVGHEYICVTAVSARRHPAESEDPAGLPSTLYYFSLDLDGPHPETGLPYPPGPDFDHWRTAPVEAGMLHITEVHGLRLTLTSARGITLYFDVAALQFVPSLDATPLPPSPTALPPTPYPR